MKIAITGVTGFRNRGVEALVQPIASGLREVFPQSELVVFSGSPDYDAPRLGHIQVNVVAEGGIEPLKKGRKRRLAERLHLLRSTPPEYGWPELKEVDLLLVTGGDVFSSEYGDWSFERHLVPMRIALQHGKPFVVFAQSIGPFTSERHRASWMEVASRAALISVRERRTYAYLTKDLGLSEERVHLVADPAFLLHADETSRRWLKNAPRSSEEVVAISLSQGICQWTGVPRESWLASWVDLIHRMEEHWGVGVVLVPHVQEPYANDLIACTDVWRRLNFTKNVTLLGADFSASELKGVIGECSMVVAERMHAGIAGLSSGVCTSIVAYSVKARGIIDDLLGTELAAAGAVLEGNDFVYPDKVWANLDRIWKRRGEIAGHIAERLPNTQSLARSAFTMLPKALKVAN